MTAFGVVECPRCDAEGHIQTYDPATFNDIAAHIPAVMEVPCPTCGARMGIENAAWRCPICHAERPTSKGVLIEELSGYARGKPGVLMGVCPACNHSTGVNGGPDGELACGECGEFYAGQYSAEWFAYADWLQGGPAVMNPREADAATDGGRR